jgi:hypothetical protein
MRLFNLRRTEVFRLVLKPSCQLHRMKTAEDLLPPHVHGDHLVTGEETAQFSVTTVHSK